MRLRTTSWQAATIASFAGLVLAIGTTDTVRANVKLPAIFTDHMVLQQGQKDRVWGWADAGETVKVTIANQSHETKAAGDGKWMVTLDPLPIGGPHTLAVMGKNKLEVQDVLVGEVWICS